MDFISWLDDNLSWEKRREGCGKITGDALLKDKGDAVRVRIRKLGSAVIIIPDDVGQWRILKPGDWDKTSDFIILGDRPGYGQYVFLIELKTTTRAIEEYRRDRKDDGGRMELRWNINLFHYVLSTYNVDTLSKLEDENFTIRRFLIGKRNTRRLENRIKKGRVRGDVFDYEFYEGVWINHLATSGGTFPLSVRDMLTKSK